MTMEELEAAVIDWANERCLYEQSSAYTRMLKFKEECRELEDEIIPLKQREIDRELILLEAGDVIVTLINLLHPFGMDLQMCLDAAYQKIKNRTGKMINGTFVKDRVKS